MGFERALGVSREVRSVALSQGPGATFPEMSQAPALSGVSRTKAGWVWRAARWREHGALSPGVAGARVAWKGGLGDWNKRGGNRVFLHYSEG